MMRIHRRTLGVGLLAILMLLPVAPEFPAYWVTLFNLIGLASLVALGLVLLTGVGGLTSFGQAAFCGFGAYTTAVLTTAYDISPWATLPIALVVTVAVAAPLGLVTLRLSGHYLPLGTIAWGLALYYMFGQLDFLGRYDGFSHIRPLSIGGYELYSDRSLFYVIWAFVLLCIVGAQNLLDSRVGRAIRALRGGEIVANSFGVNVIATKMTVFIIAALLAGLSGWLYAHMQRTVNPTPFGLNMGIEYLLMAVVGGAGHVWGALFGAGFVVILKDVLQRILPQIFGNAGNYELIVFGILLVAILQWAKTGLWPIILSAFPDPTRQPVVRTDTGLPRRDCAGTGKVLLEVEGVCKRFGGLVAVDHVSFRVRAGEIVGLIGPNGAGKSTIFNLITGVIAPTAGRIVFDGEQLISTPRLAALRGIGRTFQHAKILSEMTVLENAALGAHSRGAAGSIRAMLRLDRAEEANLLAEAAHQLERVGLGAHLHWPAGSLALGQVRLLEIARALALDPRLLMLDEPAAGLRHHEKQELAALLRKLREEGVGLLLVEHDMGFVMSLTDHIVVLDFGTKIAEGTPEVVKKHPAVIDAYLGGAV